MTLEIFRRSTKEKIKQAVSVYYDGKFNRPKDWKPRWVIWVQVGEAEGSLGACLGDYPTKKQADDQANHIIEIITDLALGKTGHQVDLFGRLDDTTHTTDRKEAAGFYMEQAAMELVAEQNKIEFGNNLDVAWQSLQSPDTEFEMNELKLDQQEALAWARYIYGEYDLTWEELAASIDFIHCYGSFQVTPYDEHEFAEVVLEHYGVGPLIKT